MKLIVLSTNDSDSNALYPTPVSEVMLQQLERMSDYGGFKRFNIDVRMDIAPCPSYDRPISRWLAEHIFIGADENKIRGLLRSGALWRIDASIIERQA